MVASLARSMPGFVLTGGLSTGSVSIPSRAYRLPLTSRARRGPAPVPAILSSHHAGIGRAHTGDLVAFDET